MKTILKLALSLALAGLFLWAAFRSVDLQALWLAIQQVNLFWVVVTAVLFLASILPRAWRWRILLSPISKEISFWRISSALLIAYAGNNVFPRAGEIARAVAVKQGKDLSLSAILATVLVERAIDMLVLLMLFGGVLLSLRKEIASIFPWMEGVALLAFAATLAGLMVFALLSAYGERALHLVERVVGKLSQPLAHRVVEIFRALFQGLAGVRTTSGYVGILVSSLLLNIIYVLGTYCTFLAFNLTETYGLGLAAALVIMVVSTVGVIIPTPGGTGTFHYFCSQAVFHLYAVPRPEALAFATVVHGIVFITYLSTGGPGLLKMVLRHQMRPSAESSPS
ncbi:MAG: lysylphosphatidylglycerol synthase transmembrane domain-containing protein [bacterium]|nr:lysylphosphatidylglycerol synthase transmembrane domain-containing protein [bacterium]